MGSLEVKLPFILTQDRVNAGWFDTRFGKTGCWRQNIWRRHQYEANASLSGWTPGARRRRILHFHDKYTLVDGKFAISHFYLRVIWGLPAEEAQAVYERLQEAACQSAYASSFDVSIGIKRSVYDLAVDQLEDDYLEVDCTICDPRHPITPELLVAPWWIFALGPRETFPEVSPRKITDVSELSHTFPWQVELGCGPSIECGVPPLNAMHDTYKLTDVDHKFNWELLDGDPCLRILRDPPGFYREAARLHLAGLHAKPTLFYSMLVKGLQSGAILSPVFNNNFDGVLESAIQGQAYSLRSRDRFGDYSGYPVNPDAKTLVVVGSHADRRQLQRQFLAKAGKTVVFVDPEHYPGAGSYPLECPWEGALHLPVTANEFAQGSIETFPGRFV